jgi:hypothetical protein
MSGTTTQVTINAYNHSNILSAILTFLEEYGNWSGSATQLVKLLGVNIDPRVLSVELRKLKAELENNGIFIIWKRSHGRNIIAMSINYKPPVVAHNERKHIHPTNLTSDHKDFATPVEKELISSPFRWRYGEIRELAEEERIEVNNEGKHCAICGDEGPLEYRKVSDGNPCLICKPCAEKYERSAMNLQQQEDFKKDVM